jgi:nudix-type nucleoside diphosphatase (YffH/AdpP family)
MPSDTPRIVARRSAYKGWNKLDIVTVDAVDADGRPYRVDREVVDHGEAAVVLLIDRSRGVAVMVRQWRAPLLAAGADPYLLEACAGILDPGETPEQAARREAEEETGLSVGELRKIGVAIPSGGTLTERMHLYVAEVATEGAEGNRAQPHEGEHIEVIEVPLRQLYDMAMRGEIEDAKTLIIVQRLMIEAADHA